MRLTLSADCFVDLFFREETERVDIWSPVRSSYHADRQVRALSAVHKQLYGERAAD